MYHPSFVQARLDRAFRLLNADQKFRRDAQLGQNETLEPSYHSPKEVVIANTHFRNLLTEEGTLRRALKPDEHRWYRNERLLCMSDAMYYYTRYARIQDAETQRIVPFTLNISQKIIFDIWSQMELDRISILIDQLKARRLGVSTLWEIEVARRVQFFSNVNAVVASSDPDKSAEMAGIMELNWLNQPWFLLPNRSIDRANLIEFGSQNSAVSIQHGNQFTGIARGASPSIFHLSEIPGFANPEDLIDASLLRAIIDSPETFGCLESTAEGRGNWWHKQWKFAVENWPRGRSRLRPIFLPWYCGRDIYPTDAWMRPRPIPEGYGFEQATIDHAERAKEYVRTNDLLRKYLGEDWRMPPEQMWFWEVTKAEYAAKDELDKFYSELCSDDLEAFQSSGRSPFSVDLLSDYREHAGREPVCVYGFRSFEDVIPTRLHPERREIDPNKKPIVVRPFPNAPPLAPREVELVPLKFQGYSGFDPFGKLLVWKAWEAGYEYANGIDTSYGIGQDRSAIETLRKGTLDENDYQCAEFASPNVSGSDLAPIAYVIGKLYSGESRGVMRQCRQAIEVQTSGENLQLELRKMGWTAFHHWVRYDRKRINPKRGDRLGWATVPWSRAILMDWMIKALRDGWIDINSPFFVDEMQDLAKDDEQQSLRAVYGCHDDRWMGMGIAYVSLNALDMRRGQPLIGQRRAQAEASGGRETYSAGDQARAVWAQGAEAIVEEEWQ